MSDDIEAAMVAELTKHHSKAQALIGQAHATITAATETAAYVGALVDKVATHKKSTVYQWVGEHANIDGHTARSYVLAYTTDQKRMACSDRRCLLKLGILDGQINTETAPKIKRAPATLNAKIHRANRAILGHIEKRPVSVMNEGERLMLRHNLEGLAKLYVEASKPS